MNSPKPVVTYKDVCFGNRFPVVVGQRALLYGVKHHPFCHGEKAVHTSPVISIGENGAFETLNTLYVKEEFNLS